METSNHVSISSHFSKQNMMPMLLRYCRSCVGPSISATKDTVLPLDQSNANHRLTLAATMLLVRTSFPLLRSWSVSPCVMDDIFICFVLYCCSFYRKSKTVVVVWWRRCSGEQCNLHHNQGNFWMHGIWRCGERVEKRSVISFWWKQGQTDRAKFVNYPILGTRSMKR